MTRAAPFLIRMLKLGTGKKIPDSAKLFASGKEIQTGDVRTPSDKIVYEKTVLLRPFANITKIVSVKLTSVCYSNKFDNRVKGLKVHVFTRVLKKVPTPTFFHYIFLRENGFLN